MAHSFETRGKRKSLKLQWIGKITTQQTKTSKVNTVSCILLNILASIHRFESFTWILIQILYIHGHFKLRNMRLHVLMIKLTHWAWAACGQTVTQLVSQSNTQSVTQFWTIHTVSQSVYQWKSKFIISQQGFQSKPATAGVPPASSTWLYVAGYSCHYNQLMT